MVRQRARRGCWASSGPYSPSCSSSFRRCWGRSRTGTGRRPVVLLSNFGLGLDYLLMAWAPALSWLFVGRVISGLTASSVPTAMAYMTDVTPAEKRASAFGLLGAAFGMGFVLGPALGGVLGSISPRLPFWVSGGLSLVNGLYGLLVLPESLSRENRSPFSWKRANPVGSLGLLRRSKVLLGLAALLLLGYLSQQSLMNVYVIYADYRFPLERSHGRFEPGAGGADVRAVWSAAGKACGEDARGARSDLGRTAVRGDGVHPDGTLEDGDADVVRDPRLERDVGGVAYGAKHHVA